MTPERMAKIKTVLARRQPDLTLLTDQVHKPRNIAALVRTCDAVGIGRMHAVQPQKSYRPFNGTAKGSQQWVEVQMHESVEHGVQHLKEQGFAVVAAHWSERAQDYREWDFCQPTALLLGAERMGVSDWAAEQADAHLVVPMMGMVSSLNVSVAAGIILQEAQTQRWRNGLYEQMRLSDSEFERLFFEWAHPRVAASYKKMGLPYPELDAEGDIVPHPLPDNG